MRNKILMTSFLSLVSFLSIQSTPAMAARTEFPVQGVLTDENGTALSGDHTITLNLYSSCEDASVLLTADQSVTTDSDGFFKTSLDLSTATDEQVTAMNQSETLCLGVAVDGDTELTPRMEYSTVPYARVAQVADLADVATVAMSIDSSALSGILGSGLAASGSTITLDTTSSNTWSGSQSYSGQVVLSKAPSDTTSANASLLVNPTLTDANAKLFALQNSGTDKFSVNGNGDVTIAGDLSVTGSMTLPSDSVVTANIVDGTIAAADLASDSVTTAKILDGTIATADIAADAVTSAKIAADTITAGDLSATLTFADADLINFSAINSSGTGEGLILPQGANVSAATAEGQISWDSDDDTLYVGTGSSVVNIGNPFGADIGTSEITDGTIATADLANNAVTSAKILDGEIVNADISGSAAIAYSKLNLSGSIVTGDITDGTIAAADLASGAVTSAKILDGEIVNGDISASAAIAYSKLNLSSSIVTGDITDGTIANADISGSAAIAYSKLNLSGSILTGDITDGTIATGDIAANTITTSNLAAALTFADGDLINLAAVNASGTSEGLILPQAANVSAGTAEGQISWDSDNDRLYVGDGASVVEVSNPFGSAVDTADITDGTITGDDINSNIAGDGLVLTSASPDTLDIGAGTGITVSANAVAVDQSTAFTWTGQQSWTSTVTATGAIQQVNLTLGGDADVDTVAGLQVAVTSANTGDADVVYGVNIDDVTSADGTVHEYAIGIGANWDEVFDVNGTLISSAELTLLDGGVTLGELTNSGTLTATTVDINGGAIDGTTLGASTPASVKATTLETTGQTKLGGNVVFQTTVNTLVDADTFTVAKMLGKIVTSDTSGAAVGVTTDTAANIVAAVTGAAVGDTLEIMVVVEGGNDLTISAGSDVTLVGDASINANTSRIIRCRMTNVGGGTEAVTCYL